MRSLLVALALLAPAGLASADLSAADLAIAALAVEDAPDAPFAKVVRVRVENLGDAAGEGDLLVHVVGRSGGWRVLAYENVALAPGASRELALAWDTAGTVGDVDVHADTGSRDRDGSNNWRSVTVPVLVDGDGRGFILLNGNGGCVRPFGVGTCGKQHVDDEGVDVTRGAGAFVHLFAGAERPWSGGASARACAVGWILADGCAEAAESGAAQAEVCDAEDRTCLRAARGADGAVVTDPCLTGPVTTCRT